jgi:predicted transcriptional regulator
MTEVRELMTEGVLTCPPDASPTDIAGLLVRHRVHAIFVLDDDGQPNGVVSDTDLITGESAGGGDGGLPAMRDVTARQLMTAPVLTIDADVDVTDAAARLAEAHVGRFLVIDDGRPAGVLSVSDVVAFIAGSPRPRKTLVQVMSHAIVVSQPDVSIAAAARAMTERRSRSIVVVDVAGRPVGVVTGHDLLRVLGDDRALTVADVMSDEILGIAPDASLREAAERMLRHRVHRLVVVDPTPGGAAPIGVISTADIVAAMTPVAPEAH